MDAIVEDFTGIILKAADGVFTKSSGKSVRKGQNQCWTQDCDEAVRERDVGQGDYWKNIQRREMFSNIKKHHIRLS